MDILVSFLLALWTRLRFMFVIKFIWVVTTHKGTMLTDVLKVVPNPWYVLYFSLNNICLITHILKKLPAILSRLFEPSVERFLTSDRLVIKTLIYKQLCTYTFGFLIK